MVLRSPKATPSDSSASSTSQNSDERSSPTGAGSEDARSSSQVSQGAVAASVGSEEETHGSTLAAPGTTNDLVSDPSDPVAE